MDIPLSIILHDSFFFICSKIALSILGVYRDVWRYIIVPFYFFKKVNGLQYKGGKGVYSHKVGLGIANVQT